MQQGASMLDLQQWQNEFVQQVVRGEQAGAEFNLSLQDSARLHIYKNNIYHSQQQALAAQFPIVKQLVGERFFNGCCVEYIKNNTDNSSAMIYTGQLFSNFLQNFPPCSSLPYLSDIAALEWQTQRVRLACEQSAMCVQDFEQIDIERLQHSQVHYISALHLMQSDYGIYDIWAMHQADAAKQNNSIDINQSQQLLITRQQQQMHVLPLSQANYHCLFAWQQGSSILRGIEQTMQQHADFDASAIIQFCIMHGLIYQLIEEKS